MKWLKDTVKSSYYFWKGFIVEKEKDKFLKNNKESLKTQIIVLLAAILTIFVAYSTMKPVVRGACRVILQSDENPFSAMRGRLTAIEARKVVIGPTQKEVKSIGTLKANQEVIIKSEIPAKISEILFTEGGDVLKGDELIKFEDDHFKAEKAKYEADYAMRKAEFERVSKLFEKNVGSKKAYDEAFAQMNASKAQLDAAKHQLSKTIIKAPFSGVIGILKGTTSPGNIVQQHSEIVAIVDNSIVKVEFTVPAKYIQDIAVGQNVEITVDAFKDRVFSGTVDAIDSEIDSRSHSVLVRAVIPNKSGDLRHGMFANVKLITGEKEDVILVEEDSLDREGAIEFVWIVDDKGRSYRKRVLTGAKDMNGVEVLAGLKEGDIVVTSGQLKLTDGAKVKILNKEDFEEKELKKQKKLEEEALKEDSTDDEKKVADNENHESLTDQKVCDDEGGKKNDEKDGGAGESKEKTDEDGQTASAEKEKKDETVDDKEPTKPESNDPKDEIKENTGSSESRKKESLFGKIVDKIRRFRNQG